MKKNTTKPKSKQAKAETSTKPVLVCLLLDRSGSMANCIDETIGAFNGYIEQLKKQQPKSTRFSLTTFDSVSTDVINDAAKLEDVEPLTKETFKPRGNTPLYDAMGKAIQDAQAKAGKKFKVLFVSQTDGQENCSSDWTAITIKDLISRREREDGWTFAHIGTGADGWAQGQRMYAGTRSVGNVLRSRHGASGQSMASLATATMAYTCSVDADHGTVKDLFKQEKEDK